MKASTKKAWSIRSLRWMAQMPEELIEKDVKLKSTKKELKEWVRGAVPVKGDRILWGQKLTGEMRRKRRKSPAEPEDDNDRSDKEKDPGKVQEEREEGDQDSSDRETGQEENQEEKREGTEGVLERKVYLRTRVLQERKNHNKEHQMLMEMKARSWRIGP